MNIFSLSYPEYRVATLLQEEFPKKAGYSVFIPVSRQEEGVDLMLVNRRARRTKTATIQVKASRTYEDWEADSAGQERHTYHTWCNTFAVSERADWYLLVGIWPPKEGRTKKVGFQWQHMILAFTRGEMARFLSSVKTVGGKPDSKFSFGFDDEMRVFLSRGDQHRRYKDYSHRLFQYRIAEIRRSLS